MEAAEINYDFMSSDQNIEQDLDLTSPEFNPQNALYSSQVYLPTPSAKTFDNLAQFESFCKRKGKRRAPVDDSTAGPSSKVAGDTKSSMPSQVRSLKLKAGEIQESEDKPKTITRRQRLMDTTVFDVMKESVSKGPLQLLHKCMSEGMQVRVWTRNYKLVRGICHGYIVAFDKHMNLAMADVTETYRNPVWRSDSSLRRIKKQKSLAAKLVKEQRQQTAQNTSENSAASPCRDDVMDTTEQCLSEQYGNSENDLSFLDLTKPDPRFLPQEKTLQRHVNQLFIRGDNVVMVVVVDR